MDKKVKQRRRIVLLAGDLITIALITLSGFASHGTLMSAGTRVLSTFVPLVLGWLAIAPFMGAYQLESAARPSQLWRPFWAMVVAAPFAGWMRGVWLNAAIQPLFVFVLGGVASIGILIWRTIYCFWIRRGRSSDG